MEKRTITEYFKLHAGDNLDKTENIFQAYVKGAEDCYDFMQEVKTENKNCKNWEAEYNCLLVKMNEMSRSYEEKLKARENHIKNLENKNDVLRAKVEMIELIFGK